MSRSLARASDGVTLLELLVMVAIIGTLAGVAALVLPSVVTLARADSGASEAMSLLRTCREQAITERRNVEIAFVGVQRIECRRREINADGTPNGTLTLVQQVRLGQRIRFQRFAGLPDTPDGFAAGADPVSFTGTGPWSFTSEGSLVDVNGDIVNGTVFLGEPSVPATARAVTLFGATAFLHEWRWGGARWME